MVANIEVDGTRAQLKTLGDAAWELIEPIDLVLSVDETFTDWVVIAEEIDEWGEGDSVDSAVEDLQECVVALYEFLNDPELELGPDMERLRLIINTKVRPA